LVEGWSQSDWRGAAVWSSFRTSCSWIVSLWPGHTGKGDPSAGGSGFGAGQSTTAGGRVKDCYRWNNASCRLNINILTVRINKNRCKNSLKTCKI